MMELIHSNIISQIIISVNNFLVTEDRCVWESSPLLTYMKHSSCHLLSSSHVGLSTILAIPGKVTFLTICALFHPFKAIPTFQSMTRFGHMSRRHLHPGPIFPGQACNMHQTHLPLVPHFVLAYEGFPCRHSPHASGPSKTQTPRHTYYINLVCCHNCNFNQSSQC